MYCLYMLFTNIKSINQKLLVSINFRLGQKRRMGQKRQVGQKNGQLMPV